VTNQKSSWVDLDRATAGMTLSEPILDAHHSVLLPGGAVLTDAAITSLRRRGIEQIPVVGDAASDAEREAARAAAGARLDRLFRRSGTQSPTDLLYDYISHYRLD
jgi:hypothetical protein